MVDKLYYTPLYWPETLRENGLWLTSGMKRTQNFVESYFQWCSREVAVVQAERPTGDLEVNLEMREAIWWHTLLKVITCATLIIPAILFITRAFLRLRCTLHINVQTQVSDRGYKERGRFDAANPRMLVEGMRTYEDGRVETRKSKRADDQWIGSRLYPNQDQEIGQFSTTGQLVMGTKITKTSTEYVLPKILLSIPKEVEIAFAQVWISPEHRQMRVIQRRVGSGSSYEPYSGSPYEAVLRAASIYYDTKLATVLEGLTDKDYFDPEKFFIFLTTLDPEGNLPALQLNSDALKLLLNHYKAECSKLDVARKDSSTTEAHAGQTLFSFWMRWSEESIIDLLLKHCYSSCVGQMEERAINFFSIPVDPIEPPVTKMCAMLSRVEEEETPVNQRLLCAIADAQTDPAPCYNLANLFNPIELTNKEKRLALHCVPKVTLLKLCELYSQGKITFEQTGVTKGQFLTVVDPNSKDNLLTIWAKKGDVSVLKTLLAIDPPALKQEPRLSYFAIAVDAGRIEAAELFLTEMEKHGIPLTPLEIWFKKIKESDAPLEMTSAEKEQFTREELAMLLRAAQLYKQFPFAKTLRTTYGVANTTFLPKVLMQKILSFVGYSGARVSSQFHEWIYTLSVKEIAENVIARLLPVEVFTSIAPALSKLNLKFHHLYLRSFYSHNHNPHVFFAQLEFLRDCCRALEKKKPEFRAPAQLLSTITEELPKRVQDLQKGTDIIVGKPGNKLRDEYVEYRLDSIEEQVGIPYRYTPGQWLTYEGRIARIETALKSYDQLKRKLADL